MKTIQSPVRIAGLIHAFTTESQWTGAPWIMDDLHDDGLILPDGKGGWKATDAGMALMQHLCKTPLPVKFEEWRFPPLDGVGALE